MSKNEYIISGVCPYCPAVLDYSEEAKAVKCYCCGNVVPTAILKPLNFKSGNYAATENEKRIADCVSSPTTGIIYFDNYCEGFDWKNFAMNDGLSIPALDAISEVCKLKFPADPMTYYLDFRCIAIPVLKKIDGLEVLETEIMDNYRSDDISDLFEYVDVYRMISRSIADRRKSLIKSLQNDIMLARRFAADPTIIADLESSYNVFVKRVKSVKAINSIEDIPSYCKAKEQKDAKLAANIRAIGIDAERTYNAALQLLERGNVDNALHLFAAINGYKDSTKYINEHTTIFRFGEELARMAGRFYAIKKNGKFDVSNPEASTPNTLSLYEIKNNEPVQTPSVTQMSDIIYNFGTKIFFIRNSVSICCYDTESTNYNSNVKILDEAPSGDYVTDHATPIYYSSDKTKFFIRKKLREKTEKHGCFGRKERVLNTINRANNYSIVLVDMDDVTSKTIIPEAVDIMDFCNDKIFYTTVTYSESLPALRVYDIKERTDTEILPAGSIVHSAKNERIIYSVPSPNIYNMDIYSLNTKTDEHSLIDSNISGYYATYGIQAYYTVGSDPYGKLYAANLDGSGKHEVMEISGRILTISSGWIYYVNGEGYQNACLMKVKIDGSETSFVASRFNKIIKIMNGYIYYLSSNGELRVVRSDGNGDALIASGLADAHIIIDDNNVYYLKRDYLGPDAKDDGFGCSLYSTDLFGKNLHKIAHDVDSMADRGDSYIYIRKKSPATFSVTTPVDKKTTTTEIVKKDLVTYVTYDKETGEFSTIVNLGKPEQPSLSYNKGFLFFKRNVTRDGMVYEFENKKEFRRDGVSEVGKIRDEEIAEAERLEEERYLNSRRYKREQKKLERQARKQAEREAEERFEAESEEQANDYAEDLAEE